MARDVEFVLKARDEATREITRVSGSLGHITASVERLTSTMGGLGIAAVSFTALATGALTAARGFADFAETLDRQAKSAGTSTANMQALQRAFEQAGLTGADASLALTRLNRAIDEGNLYLGELGISSRDAFEVFLQLGPALSRVGDAARRTRIVNDLLGRGMAENAGIIGDLSASTENIIVVYRRFGATMDTLATQQATKLDERFDSLDTRMNAAWTSLGKRFTPAVLGAVEGSNRLLDVLGKVVDKLGSLDDKLHAGGLARLLNLSMLPGGSAVAPILLVINRLLDLAERAPDLKLLPAHGWPTALRTPVEGIDFALAGEARIPLSPLSSSLAARVDRIRGDASGASLGLRIDEKDQDAVLKRLKKRLDDLTRMLEEADVPEPRHAPIGEYFDEQMRRIESATAVMRSQVAGNISSAVDAVARGVLRIDLLFQTTMKSIVADLAASAAKLGIGLGLGALGWAIGGPIGGVVADIGGRVAGSNALAPAGGGVTNIHLSTMSSRDLTDQLLFGEWRRANDRVLDISRAGR